MFRARTHSLHLGQPRVKTRSDVLFAQSGSLKCTAGLNAARGPMRFKATPVARNRVPWQAIYFRVTKGVLERRILKGKVLRCTEIFETRILRPCSSCSDSLESADDDVCHRRNRGSLPHPPRARFRRLVFPRTCSASEGGCTRPSSSFRHHGRRHRPCNARAFVRHQRSRWRIDRSRFAADGRISLAQTPPVRPWVTRDPTRFKPQE